MKIVGLQISNFKILKAVSITPQGNTVVISGPNGAGKSSVLDAIWAALAGREAASATPKPIREGQSQAEVTVDLGKYKVTRKWTQKGSYLTVESSGLKQEKPQDLLNTLYSDLTFDPLEFARRNPKEQREILLLSANLREKLELLDQDYETNFRLRTDANRTVDRLDTEAKAAAAETTALPPCPQMRSDPAALLSLLEKQEEANRITVGMENGRVQAVTRMRELDDQIAKLTEERNKVAETHRSLTEDLATRPIIDSAPTKKAIEESNVNNRSFDAHARFKDLSQKRDKARIDAEALTATLEQIQKKKTDLVQSAPLPVAGLSFTDDGVLVNGIPFEQLSSAQKLKVSLAIAMAAKPELRIIRILDGSLLDGENMKVIEEMAKEKDYQVWIEVVDESGKRGIVIEEGEVSAINPSTP
ncbi:MAG: AAA family ATPase [Candidatus Peribacteraceae bacterium]|nr:AAA family ATPase [Candidatus Peribacteraceae bacterium]